MTQFSQPLIPPAEPERPPTAAELKAATELLVAIRAAHRAGPPQPNPRRAAIAEFAAARAALQAAYAALKVTR